MKLNFKQPKYVLPLLMLPFFCLFFYGYKSFVKPKASTKKQDAGMQSNIGEVSDDVKKKDLSSKLDAYRNAYKNADANATLTPLQEEKSAVSPTGMSNSAKQQKLLDSISQATKNRFGSSGVDENARLPKNNLSASDQALALALSNLSKKRKMERASQTSIVEGSGEGPKEHDPMETFKKQMAYLDSVKKSNDPAYKAEMQKKLALEQQAKAIKDQNILQVQKADESSSYFNTLTVKKEKTFIKAIVDENVTGYAGSRIRIRLLDDIMAGNHLIKKGTYIYAEINGFSQQRVTLAVTSILSDDKIFPVKLTVYDLDGMPGLYVPASAFRDFSKDLGTNTIQGVSVDNTSQSFSMSIMDKVFESTSTAVADLIRKNKAKVKYDTFVYLIDPQQLKNEQKNY